MQFILLVTALAAWRPTLAAPIAVLVKRDPQLSSIANVLPDPLRDPVKAVLNYLPIRKRDPQLDQIIGIIPDPIQGPLKALLGSAAPAKAAVPVAVGAKAAAKPGQAAPAAAAAAAVAKSTASTTTAAATPNAAFSEPLAGGNFCSFALLLRFWC